MIGMMGWGVQGQGWRKGPWTPEEDELLTQYVKLHGEGRWSSVSRSSGLNRSGKSCRLRWVNYLRPGLKRGHITPQEEGIIIELHAIWGNKWSTIARYLPGRTDNEIKNYWRTHFKKRDRSYKKRKPQLLRQQNWHQMREVASEKNQSMFQENPSQHHHQQQVQHENHPAFEAQTSGYNNCIIHPTSRDWNHGEYMLSKEISTSSSSWPDFRIEEELWGGLWNFDDPSSLDHNTGSNNCNKVAPRHIRLPSPTGAVYEGNPYNVNYGGNYIV